MKRNWLVLPILVSLAACGGGAGEGTQVSIEGGDGNTSIRADKDGRVAIRAPGFEGSIKLPKFRVGADDFDIDGVKLYPGSTIASLNVEGGPAGDGGTVRVVFDAPAATAQVHDWFRERMQGAGFTVTATPEMLSGKTGDGSPYTLKLAPAGDGRSRGTLLVSGT